MLNQGNRCLVIGGNGFIGMHLVKALSSTGRLVTVLDTHASTIEHSSGSVRYIKGDYGDKSLMETLLSEHNEVVHLAYATQPNTSFDNPFNDLSLNVPPTIQLFEMAAAHGVRVLFVSSGGTVYGDTVVDRIKESHPTNPISPYGVTKLSLEKYAYLYGVTKGLNVVCVRPSNPYGEGQKPFLGQGFVSTALMLILQGNPVTIYGEKGTVRDYIYVEDLALGMVKALEKGVKGGMYNIGSSIGLSNLDVINKLSCLLQERGVEAVVSYQPKRPFDVARNVLDCCLLKRLDWEPKYCFEDGVKKLLRWIEKC